MQKVFPESQVCLFEVCVFIPDLLHFDMILSSGKGKTIRDFISRNKLVPYILMLLHLFLECCIQLTARLKDTLQQKPTLNQSLKYFEKNAGKI